MTTANGGGNTSESAVRIGLVLPDVMAPTAMAATRSCCDNGCV